MGIEAFGVSMRFVERAVFERIKIILEEYPQVLMQGEDTSVDSQVVTGVYSDSRHFIEIQLARETATNRCTLALRFSLCSYNSIDAIFIDLVRTILSSLEAEVWLMTSALKQKANYLPGDAPWLVSALSGEISEMREHWQNLFGNKQGRVRVRDSYAFVGVLGKKSE